MLSRVVIAMFRTRFVVYVIVSTNKICIGYVIYISFVIFFVGVVILKEMKYGRKPLVPFTNSKILTCEIQRTQTGCLHVGSIAVVSNYE